MKFSVILRSSLYSLKKNARRTFLTMLGIIIGIASVITIMSLGNGYSRHSVETLTKDEQGRQNVDFFYEMTSEVDVPNFSPFSDKTMEKLNEIDGVSEAAESQYEADNQPYYEIKAREHSESLAVDVAAKNYDRTMVAGRMLTLDEQKTFLPYAVIDDELARKMYGTEENALNKGVKINNYSFTIIGVMAREGDGSFGSNVFATPGEELETPPGNAIIPARTYEQLFKEEMPRFGITVYIELGRDPKKVSERVKSALDEFGSGAKYGTYSFIDNSEIMREIGKQLQTTTYFVSSVAGISLFIAGVGVMNMMYISVSERIREIGIRRSLGSTKQAIQLQFLLEGILITVIGGIFGFVLGLAIAYGVSTFLPFGIGLTPIMVVGTIGVSTLIGIVFSVFPARSAANKNLIEILR